MKIYLVRHGETFFNTIHRIQGWCDSPLTQEGIQQATQLGIGLSNVAFCAAYSSTSERAMDTAKLIVKNRKLEVTCLKGLKELNFGSLEAEYEHDVLARDGRTHEIGYVAYGGENRQMVQERMLSTLLHIAKEHPDGNVLVVSHGASIMNALMKIDAKKVQAYRKEGHHIENCSVSIIEVKKETITLEVFSDITYRQERIK